MDKKVLSAAIECHMCMYWLHYYSELQLRVVTVQFENGRQYSRLIHRTTSLEDAYKVSFEIYERGGALICDELFDLDDPWRFGWHPEMSDDQHRLRRLNVPTRIQPLWDEFAARVRRRGKR